MCVYRIICRAKRDASHVGTIITLVSRSSKGLRKEENRREEGGGKNNSRYPKRTGYGSGRWDPGGRISETPCRRPTCTSARAAGKRDAHERYARFSLACRRTHWPCQGQRGTDGRSPPDALVSGGLRANPTSENEIRNVLSRGAASR